MWGAQPPSDGVLHKVSKFGGNSSLPIATCQDASLIFNPRSSFRSFHAAKWNCFGMSRNGVLPICWEIILVDSGSVTQCLGSLKMWQSLTQIIANVGWWKKGGFVPCLWCLGTGPVVVMGGTAVTLNRFYLRHNLAQVFKLSLLYSLYPLKWYFKLCSESPSRFSPFPLIRNIF